MTAEPTTVAVVEIGAGSVKLLVTQSSGDHSALNDLVNHSVKTQLLKELRSRGDGRSLSSEALKATDEALAQFGATVAGVGADVVGVVATSVARDISDLSMLRESCSKHFDRPLEVLSGHREAQLGWTGATFGRGITEQVVMLDIGSGSTELALGTPLDPGEVKTFSLPIGARTVTAQYLESDPPEPAELSAALSVIELHYDDVKREASEFVPALEDGVLFGVGAIGQIARVEIGLVDDDVSVDGHRLAKVEVEEVFRALATETVEDRAYNPGLAVGHAADIVGGLCILVEFMRRFGVDHLTVSERDLRHGLALEILGDRSQDRNRN